jgi:hypothetical protein
VFVGEIALRMLGHRLWELSKHSNAQAKGPACAQERRSAARRNCNLLSQSVETNIDATGIPQDGLEWTAREEHV